MPRRYTLESGEHFIRSIVLVRQPEQFDGNLSKIAKIAIMEENHHATAIEIIGPPIGIRHVVSDHIYLYINENIQWYAASVSDKTCDSVYFVDIYNFKFPMERYGTDPLEEAVLLANTPADAKTPVTTSDSSVSIVLGPIVKSAMTKAEKNIEDSILNTVRRMTSDALLSKTIDGKEGIILQMIREKVDEYVLGAQFSEFIDNTVMTTMDTAAAEAVRTLIKSATRKHLFTATEPVKNNPTDAMVSDQGADPVKLLQWSEQNRPSEKCRYDNVTADCPLGTFRIEWKSWKERYSGGYAIYLTSATGEEFIDGTADALVGAQQIAEEYLTTKIKELNTFILPLTQS